MADRKIIAYLERLIARDLDAALVRPKATLARVQPPLGRETAEMQIIGQEGLRELNARTAAAWKQAHG